MRKEMKEKIINKQRGNMIGFERVIKERREDKGTGRGSEKD